MKYTNKLSSVLSLKKVHFLARVLIFMRCICGFGCVEGFPSMQLFINVTPVGFEVSEHTVWISAVVCVLIRALQLLN